MSPRALQDSVCPRLSSGGSDRPPKLTVRARVSRVSKLRCQDKSTHRRLLSHPGYKVVQVFTSAMFLPALRRVASHQGHAAWLRAMGGDSHSHVVIPSSYPDPSELSGFRPCTVRTASRGLGAVRLLRSMGGQLREEVAQGWTCALTLRSTRRPGVRFARRAPRCKSCHCLDCAPQGGGLLWYALSVNPRSPDTASSGRDG